MADTNNQAEQNRLLQEENKILRQQLDLKSESISLSGALLDDVKELFGIQSKRNTQEQGILSLNKEINRQINNQRISASSVNEVQKQIAKNSNLIEKSIAQQDSLNKKLSETDKKRIQNIEGSLNKLDKNEKKLQEILNLSKEERDLQKDTIKELERQIAKSNELIDNNLQNLSLDGKILVNTKLQTKELEKQNKEREKDKESLKKIEDSLGVAGKLSKLISSIPGLGTSSAKALEKVNEELKEAQERGEDLPNKMGTFKMLVKETGKNLITDLKDPFVVLTATFAVLIKQAGKIDSEIVSFQKSLNLSRDEATNLREELALAAFQSNTNFLTTSDLVKAQNNYNNLLGIQGKINTKNLETQARLVELVGVSGESAAKLQYYSEATGQNFETNYKSSLRTTHELSKQYGVQINSKKVLEDVGKTSSYNLVQFRGSTTALTEAVAKAQALGTTLEGVNKISQTLLNFQSSIESELEAELLTGKQINLEQARYYALTNQTSKLMDELVKNVGTFNEFSKINVIQQEAYAKSLGMSVGEMSDMLLKQEYLGKNGEIIKNTTDEELQNRIEQLSIQDKFNKSMEKLQDIIGSIVQGPLGTFVELVGKVLESTMGLSLVLGTIASIQLAKLISSFKVLNKSAISLLGTKRAISLQERLNLMLANAKNATETRGLLLGSRRLTQLVAQAALQALANPIGALVGIAAAATVGAVAYKYLKGNDVKSPGYGKRTLLAPEGAIQLNDKDTVLAGTNLEGNKSKESTSIMSPSINMQPLIDEMVAVRTILTSILNKEGNVSIDGNIVGKTLALAQYNTGS